MCFLVHRMRERVCRDDVVSDIHITYLRRVPVWSECRPAQQQQLSLSLYICVTSWHRSTSQLPKRRDQHRKHINNVLHNARGLLLHLLEMSTVCERDCDCGGWLVDWWNGAYQVVHVHRFQIYKSGGVGCHLMFNIAILWEKWGLKNVVLYTSNYNFCVEIANVWNRIGQLVRIMGIQCRTKALWWTVYCSRYFTFYLYSISLILFNKHPSNSDLTPHKTPSTGYCETTRLLQCSVWMILHAEWPQQRQHAGCIMNVCSRRFCINTLKSIMHYARKMRKPLNMMHARARKKT